ncbi:hypothetical protein D0X99_09195 [Algoriphagus lacus]|uniref:Neutral/alkaline non-lysosomal ceramidase N-terminal domain-containing protein n=1 Tax=Algoriphagus lacus TaxID=2056311 RepID=A0A418PRV2_9BACT|nr:hypothetical protein [Algoriphagus lacus]RIW15596.1 hypothetical protein D0X99_09195 [Algoriphagus lacus]
MKKVLLGILIFLSLSILGIWIFSLYQFRDRHQDYSVDIDLKSSQKYVLAGFAKVDITPQGFETWTDANSDSRFNPEDGDTFEDANGNGEFDAIWLAGFHNSRPAQGVLDPLWARAMVLDAGDVKIALCVIDMIGFGNDEVIATRKLIEQANPELDYVIIASTHVHSSPDVIGQWGPSDYARGVNPVYLDQVQEGIRKAIEDASKAVRPAVFRFAEEKEKLKPLVGDTRPPLVFDASLKLMQVLDAETGKTLGTLMNWGNHPETLWSENIQISSDFPDPWRTMVENGISEGDSILMEGVGGVAIFLNGAVGGLMTTHPEMTVSDPYSGESFLKQSPEKMRAQGKALAKITLETLNDTIWKPENKVNLSVRAQSIELKMDNELFHLAAFLGIFERGFTSWKHIRSEVSAWTLGPATFVHVPGELYPEILFGGVESPSGADFGLEPVEVPALQTKIPRKYKFFGGLSNDMVGYIVPKSQWDAEPPFTYDYKNRPYGEINSLGPETAPKIHSEVLKILEEIDR